MQLEKIGEGRDARGLLTEYYRHQDGEPFSVTHSSGCVFFDLEIDHPEKAGRHDCSVCIKTEEATMKNPWEWVDSKSLWQHGTGWDIPVYWQLASDPQKGLFPVQLEEGKPQPEGLQLAYENWRFASEEDANVFLNWRSDRHQQQQEGA